MRVWQKIYFVTLPLFLIMLNLGLFLAARFVFSYNLEQERKKAETDCYFLCQNLEHDFSILRQNKRYKDSVIELLFEGYRNYYETMHVTVSLEQGEAGREASMRSQAKDGGGKMSILARKNLAAPYQNYCVFYDKRLTDFEKTWLDLKKMFAAISLAMSFFLCLLLYVLMRRSLKPLGRLNEGVAKIAAGEYGLQMENARNAAWNRDEIAELSRNVNKMSEMINGQIGALEVENEKKQRLMDNMAHELKTPLTSIYGYAEYLRYAKTDRNERYEGLAYIMEESMRLSKMSETMLSMRIFEKEEKRFLPVNLPGLAEHVEKILLPKLREKKIFIRRDFCAETAFGDEELLVNLFRNLLENAIRASKEGSEIVWKAKIEGQTQIFEITDYGIGMERKELERITEAFYRADKARSRKDGGVGLGLSVVDLIVKKMGGQLSFSSSPGEGTTVTILYNFVTNA